jgi:putative ABC transport system permease protein
MGMVALIVASLGMFNTLTVSLLERSREVGLMKALGMTTAEVQQLFLTESVIMGTGAGVFGLLVGYLLGKTLSLVLSTMAVFKGEGFLDISHIPFTFVVTIMILSTLVGIFTGIFPARRSKKISALDALRYE